MNDKSSMKKGADPSETLAWNMKLISHHELAGFGGVGEGIDMQLTKDGRRILWLAHESAPKNFTGVDVTDVKNPKVVVQTDCRTRRCARTRSTWSATSMAVAYQTKEWGLKPAGFDLFDISKPEEPKLISHFDASGPHSRGAHCVWFVDGEYVHIVVGRAGFRAAATRRTTSSIASSTCAIRRSRRKSGRWWYPGTRKGDSAPPPPRHPKFDAGYRTHNTNVYPQRPDRAYLGYIDGGAVILDIADKSNPKMMTSWQLLAAVQRLHAHA